MWIKILNYRISFLNNLLELTSLTQSVQKVYTTDYWAYSFSAKAVFLTFRDIFPKYCCTQGTTHFISDDRLSHNTGYTEVFQEVQAHRATCCTLCFINLNSLVLSRCQAVFLALCIILICCILKFLDFSPSMATITLYYCQNT